MRQFSLIIVFHTGNSQEKTRGNREFRIELLGWYSILNYSTGFVFLKLRLAWEYEVPSLPYFK